MLLLTKVYIPPSSQGDDTHEVYVWLYNSFF
jgi:hypothetical protein